MLLNQPSFTFYNFKFTNLIFMQILITFKSDKSEKDNPCTLLMNQQVVQITEQD